MDQPAAEVSSSWEWAVRWRVSIRTQNPAGRSGASSSSGSSPRLPASAADDL